MRKKIYVEYDYDPTPTELFLSYLFSCRSTSIQRDVLFEMIKKRNDKKYRRHANNSFSRLQKNNFITKTSDGSFKINKKKIDTYFLYSIIEENYIGTKNILVMFDISEKDSSARRWLRNQLKHWNFQLVQKSVWLGKGPLPKSFTDRLKRLDIKDGVKIFTVIKNR